MLRFVVFSFLFSLVVSAAPFDNSTFPGVPGNGTYLNFTMPDIVNKTPLRILPLGDSITFGSTKGVARSVGTSGYRDQLAKNLFRTNYTLMDFVGTQKSGSMGDNDNAGFGGMRINEIAKLMMPSLGFAPNVVLLHAGTNEFNQPNNTNGEAWEDAPQRLATLIDIITTVLPGTLVVVAKILPMGLQSWSQGQVVKYNAQIPSVVASFQERGLKVTTIDMSTMSAKFLSDKIHPTPAGYNVMANAWFYAIVTADRQGLISGTIDVTTPSPGRARVVRRGTWSRY